MGGVSTEDTLIGDGIFLDQHLRDGRAVSNAVSPHVLRRIGFHKRRIRCGKCAGSWTSQHPEERRARAMTLPRRRSLYADIRTKGSAGDLPAGMDRVSGSAPHAPGRPEL